MAGENDLNLTTISMTRGDHDVSAKTFLCLKCREAFLHAGAPNYCPECGAEIT